MVIMKISLDDYDVSNDYDDYDFNDCDDYDFNDYDIFDIFDDYYDNDPFPIFVLFFVFPCLCLARG